ncbi:putative GMC oxidoreductase [Poronia punctata]|nr:putative GMC oxidoreductase [Poronia punctata]
MGKLSLAVGLLATSAAVPSTATLASFADNVTSHADYIIVGGGPAGLVLAERLSRDGQYKVILLEAGPQTFNATLLNTPAYFPFIAEPLWNFTGEPDPNLGGISPSVPQGRVLGGGTAVNGMAYCRGAASVFDEWASISGNPGISWGSLYQDFLEVSHYTDPPAADYEQFINKKAYGDGPLEVSRSSGLVGYEAAFSESIQKQLGLHEADLNDGTGIGIDKGLLSVFARNRTRSYAGNTYGRIVSGRPNVKVLYNAWVHNIGFSGTRAVNVTYESSGETYTVRGNEIIVSAGAINTPKLLMLSGIGPRAGLENLGIPVIADRPEIGSNLRDHALSITQHLVTREILTVWQWMVNTTEAKMAQDEYTADASGPLGQGNGFVYATFRVPDSVFKGVDGTHFTSLPKDRPHILIQVVTIPFIMTNSSSITAWVSLVQPEATGQVTLKSTDYRDDPVLYTNWYGSAADKAAIIWGYKQLRKVLRRNPLKQLITEEVYPGANVTSTGDIWAAMQKQTYSFRHPVGTVALGTALDSNWRLRGLEGIRVVDSSTFPFPTTCHPQSVLYALGNRAGKDILEADGNSHHVFREFSDLGHL